MRAKGGVCRGAGVPRRRPVLLMAGRARAGSGFDERAHRVHDYGHLVRRWERAAPRAGLEMRALADVSGHTLYAVSTPGPAVNGGIYLSAGIHGDEPAGVEALLRWVEGSPDIVRRLRVLILPCLNPWGLVHNSRWDASGRDLNRHFQSDRVPGVREVKRLLRGRRFAISVTLHEDYDARGVYVYEVAGARPVWGEGLVRAAAAAIPPDTRGRVDGRLCRHGVIRRRVKPEHFEMMPEAIHLHFRHSDRTFTFETPSEFGLGARVEAQGLLIRECVRRAFGVG